MAQFVDAAQLFKREPLLSQVRRGTRLSGPRSTSREVAQGLCRRASSSRRRATTNCTAPPTSVAAQKGGRRITRAKARRGTWARRFSWCRHVLSALLAVALARAPSATPANHGSSSSSHFN